LARMRQAQESAQAAKAQVDIAQRSFNNNQALVDQGFISRTALETSLASLQAAQANYQAAWAALDVAKKSLQDTVLTAPISGLVAQRLAQPGERVGVDARMLEIVNLSRLELEAAVAGSDAAQMKVRQSAKLKLDGSGQELTATVARINPSAQAGSRSVLVYLSLPAGPGLRQGLFAQGMLHTTQQMVLEVPVSAVRTDKPQAYVQMIQNGRIVHQTVELGVSGEANNEAMIAIKNIADGALITRAGAGNIRENTLIKLLSNTAPASAQIQPSGSGLADKKGL